MRSQREKPSKILEVANFSHRFPRQLQHRHSSQQRSESSRADIFDVDGVDDFADTDVAIPENAKMDDDFDCLLVRRDGQTHDDAFQASIDDTFVEESDDGELAQAHVGVDSGEERNASFQFSKEFVENGKLLCLSFHVVF